MANAAPIGVFDSGVGGLTVVREMIERMPGESIVYFGDTARVPYGSKTQPTILRYTRQILRFLETKNVKAVVVACNTASAYALETVEKELAIPIIGVVRPGSLMAAKSTRSGRIGVIGTDATVGSGIYEQTIHRIAPEAKVFSQSCPLFVPLVEEGLWEDPVTQEMAGRYLKGLTENGVDTLIMGCTHYPLIKSVISRAVGEDVQLVNPAAETAAQLAELLAESGLTAPEDNRPVHEFFVSDAAEKMKRFANSILPIDIRETQVVNIEAY